MKTISALSAILAAFTPTVTFADPIVQTVTASDIFSIGGFGSGGNFGVEVDPFAVEGAELTSIELTGEITAAISAVSINGWYGQHSSSPPFAWTFTPSISWYSTLYIGKAVDNGSGAVTGEPVTLLDNEAYDFRPNLLLVRAWTFTDPAILAYFSAEDPRIRLDIHWTASNIYYGHTLGEARADWTLTYNFRVPESVPESCPTLLMLGTGLAGLVMLRCRWIK